MKSSPQNQHTSTEESIVRRRKIQCKRISAVAQTLHVASKADEEILFMYLLIEKL